MLVKISTSFGAVADMSDPFVILTRDLPNLARFSRLFAEQTRDRGDITVSFDLGAVRRIQYKIRTPDDYTRQQQQQRYMLSA